MPILMPDISLDIQDTLSCPTGTTPTIVVEETENTNQILNTSSGSSIRARILGGLEPLQAGSNLQSFRDLFSEDELNEARSRIAHEELRTGAPLTLARLRSSKGFSQSKLAEQIGKTQANMSLIERGFTDPGLRTIRKLSTALEVSTDEIIESIENAEALNA